MLLRLVSWCVLALHSRRHSLHALFLCLVFCLILQPDHRRHHALGFSLPRFLGGRDGEVESVDSQGSGVELAHDIREPVPAGIFQWSQYGPWTTCSASCGTGVEGRRRICVNERSEEVLPEYCVGYQRQYRLCRIESCPNSFDLGYRASRCQEIAPTGYRWRPFYPSATHAFGPCTLTCYNEDSTHEVVVLEPDVPEGTRCARFRDGNPETGVCIEGSCIRVGCDGYLNSTKYPDICGVCGGDGSSCLLVSDTIISENLQVGYFDAFEIPIGATNIRISEIHSVQNYIALSNSMGEYFVNGNWEVETDFANYFRAAGTWVRYQRRNVFVGRQWQERESIITKGPTNETLVIQILSLVYGSSNTLYYEYVIPISTSTQLPSTRNVTEGQTHPTSPTTSLPDYISKSLLGNSITENEFDNLLFDVNITDIEIIEQSLPKDSHIDGRPVVAQPQYWNVEAMNKDISAHSPGNLSKEADIDLATKNEVSARAKEKLPTHLGSSQSGPYVSTTQSTNVVEYPANGTHGNVVQGSLYHAHGDWMQTRDQGDGDWSGLWPEIAPLEETGNVQTIPMETGHRSTPSVQNQQRYSQTASNTYSRQREDEEETEADGRKYVQVEPPYQGGETTQVPIARSQSPISEPHDIPRKPDGVNSRVLEVITVETATTDLLTDELRYATGVFREEPDINQHEGDNKVDYESELPEDSVISESDYESDLSSNIENGLQYTTKASTVRRQTPSPHTTQGSIPAVSTAVSTTQSSTMETETLMITSKAAAPSTALPTTEATTTMEPPQQYFWRVTGTMSCSATCTRGITRTYAYCVNANETQVDDTMCNRDTKPEVIAKECAGRPCEARWESGSWSNCIGECNARYRFRTVHCWMMLGQGLDTTVPNNQCNQTTKPNTTTHCEEPNCGPQWETSDWSRCSAPCGPGQETRQVTCSEMGGCDASQKPSRVRPCSLGPCTWSTASWTRCPGHCQIQSRSVLCVAESTNTVMDDGDCLSVNKPLSRQLCISSCPPQWVAQEWGQCEGNCQSAVKRRAIICGGISSDKMNMYADTRCGHLPKPISSASCRKANCRGWPAPSWVSHAWSPCSVTCGTGTQTRSVRCLINGRISDRCNGNIKPQTRQECSLRACPRCLDSRNADCDLIVRANLCRFDRYSQSCCRSCQNVARRSASRERN